MFGVGLVDPNKFEGTIVGVIASIFLLLPMFWVLSDIIVPPPPGWHEYVTGAAAGIFLFFFFGSNIVGIIFAVLTKTMLKRSMVFGAIFILSGLLNLYFVIEMFGLYRLWWEKDLSVLAPPIVTILVGVSLIVPLRRLVTRQNIE